MKITRLTFDYDNPDKVKRKVLLDTDRLTLDLVSRKLEKFNDRVDGKIDRFVDRIINFTA